MINVNSVDPDQTPHSGSELFSSYPFGGLQTEVYLEK